MGRISIQADKCKGCLLCISFCPKKLIELDDQLNAKGVRPVEFKEGAECIACCQCAIICPDCCIEVFK